MEIKHILFDLDNTLYPATSAMDKGITTRMYECIMDFFGISLEEAIELRKEKIVHFSTTLEWLRNEGMNDIEGFLHHVHPESEADELTVDLNLRDFLIDLQKSYSMSILTNGPIEHASRVLNKLGIQDLFPLITDIRDCNFVGKPYASSYLSALKKANADLETTVFVDDLTKYTDGFQALGGTAILVGDKNGKPLSSDAKPLADKSKYDLGRTVKLDNIYNLRNLLERL